MTYLAGTIIFLHAIVPHTHGDGNIDQSEPIVFLKDSPLTSLFDSFLDFDLGEDHLEHFDQADVESLAFEGTVDKNTYSNCIIINEQPNELAVIRLYNLVSKQLWQRPPIPTYTPVGILRGPPIA